MDYKYFFAIILIFGLCHGVSKASECTARGRFPNDVTDDCRGYAMCLMGGLTNFTKYELKCPAGSVYSHIEEQCTNATNYKCYPKYNCTSAGNFVNPDGTECSSYIACIEGFNGLGTARWVECPVGTVFHPVDGHCVNSTDYSCTPLTVINENVAVDRNMVNISNNAVEFKIKSTLIFLLCAMLLI